MSEHPVAPRRSAIDRRVAGARAAIENLRPHELAAELATRSRSDVVLVDVRSRDECEGGAIDGAINLPRGTIESSIGSHAGVDRRIVLYCGTGDRSALAAACLYDLGYHDVAHLDGGLIAWRAAGFATVAGGRRPR